MPSAELARRVGTCLGLCLLCAAILYGIARPWKSVLTFDDAYMFSRYARNLRSGWGIAWNPGGDPTYGLTSVVWVFAILPATALLPTQQALQLSSCGAGALFFAIAAWTVVRNAQSRFLRSIPAAVAAVVLLSGYHPMFRFHLLSGMDTLLAMAANAALVFGVLRWQARRTASSAVLAAVLAFLAAAVRLDSAICALLCPALALVCSRGRTGKGEKLALLLLPFALILGQLLYCRLYFGSALPLSFYAKSAHRYEGFLNPESAARYGLQYLGAMIPELLILGSLATWSDLKKYGLFLGPALITACYLSSVRQIMGGQARFFFPLLPYFLIPSLLILDAFLAERPLISAWDDGRRSLTIKAVCVVAVWCVFSWSERSRRISMQPIAEPPLSYSAKSALPRRDWFRTIQRVGNLLHSALGGGGVVAASEVGYLGEVLPRTKMIDLAGLNDTQFALHGFSMDDLLGRAPDFIWFPHWDYTGLRAKMLRDERLYEQYEVFADGFNYGFAIRRKSRFAPALDTGVRHAWKALYPGHPIDSYCVSRSP